MRALLLVHQGSRATSALVHLVREKGFEPFVLSSATFDGGHQLGKVCSDLGVDYHVSDSVVLTNDEVLDKARELPECRFCLTIWDGQRVAMALANALLGATDAPADALALSLDKHELRRALVARGLSRLHPFRIDDAELRERVERGERYIVKPRRGSASLCTRLVHSWADVEAAVAGFERGAAENDLFVEYFIDNELIAETYFDGGELSFELIRQNGRSVISVDLERTGLEFTAETVRERLFASPPILLSAEQVAAAQAFTDEVLDTFGLDNGCYHVEVRVDADLRCEIVEINPRAGGQVVAECVRLQLGRSVGDDWVDTLLGRPVPDAEPRTRGIAFQLQYVEPGRQVLGLEHNPRLPTPVILGEQARTGDVARGDREVFASVSLWTTDLDTHQETATALLAEDHISVLYAKGLTGRPLFLVFEPTNHLYRVIEAADRRGCDVVVFHTLPLVTAGPYAAARHGIAHTVQVPSWDDVDACFERVLEVCEGSEVAGTYAALELLLPFDSRVQAHFGLPGKRPAEVYDLLDKVTVRRRLAEHGLTRLRVFDESDLDSLQTWPVGDRALFLKPVHGAGSAFVTRCRTIDEVHAAAAEWKTADKAAIPILGAYLESEGGRVFLEEEAVGEQLSVEGFVSGGSYHLVGLTSPTLLRRDPSIEMGWTFPYRHPRQDDIVDAARRFHDALGISHGATHLEVIVPPDGPVELVEANLRFIGTDCLVAMNAAADFRFEDQLVALAVGDTPTLPTRTSRVTCLQNLLPPPGLRRLESLELPADDSVVFVKHVVAPGTDLRSTDRQIDYVASFVVAGDTYQEAVDRAVDIRRRTLVNGEPLGDNPNNAVILR